MIALPSHDLQSDEEEEKEEDEKDHNYGPERSWLGFPGKGSKPPHVGLSCEERNNRQREKQEREKEHHRGQLPAWEQGCNGKASA